METTTDQLMLDEAAILAQFEWTTEQLATARARCNFPRPIVATRHSSGGHWGNNRPVVRWKADNVAEWALNIRSLKVG